MANTETDSLINWSELPKELLELILSKMHLISVYNFRAVCSPWRSAAKAYISSPTLRMANQVPWLMLPPEQEIDNNINFYNIEEKRVCKRMDKPREFDKSLCLGSSHGWLVMLDEKADPYLFNPFTMARIQLPLIETYADVIRVVKLDDNAYEMEVTDESPGPTAVRHFGSVHQLRKYFILKFVLSSNPSHNNFFVVMIFCLGAFGASQLAFCHSGDSSWLSLGDLHNAYDDIICYNDKFSALNDDVVEFWDIVDSSPVKRAELRVSVPDNLWQTGTSVRSYLVESSGDLLVVKRIIDAWINNTNLYKTRLFRIFKIDYTTKELEELESIGDHALFLGGNQSKSILTLDVPVCEANSIYFTDDSWSGLYDFVMDYDLGIYNMENKSIKSCYSCEQRTEPPPFWIDPISLFEA